MPTVVCKNCTELFYAKPSWIKNGYGKYCSRKCSSISQKNGKSFNCHICKKVIYRSNKNQNTSKSGKFFCTKSCQTHWRNSEVNIAERHPNWTTGQSSYRERLKRSGRPQTCSKCHSRDTRILAVHHKDKNRDNNKLSNLIWMCHNCHYLVHHYNDEAKGFVVPVA